MNVVNRPGDMTAGNALKQLEALGQSPWLDFIQRSFIGPKLQELIDRDGLKGITSNPAIFEKAMGHGTDYDEGFKHLAEKSDHDALDTYEALAVDDIQHACDAMRPVYEATGKIDGYVSIEVSPYLALRTDDTLAEARRLWKWVDRPNLMVKVPGTDAGIPAVQTLISEGININVTLLFAIAAYDRVAEAFVAGLEARKAAGHPVADIASVASFFVSRIDAEIDKKIDAGKGPKTLRGKVAIANAKIAYQHYLKLVATPRWKALADAGAQPQRLLWASTGVKDKAYSDVLYVEELIGRDTVNTIPPATMDAFRDHGHVRESLTEDVAGAQRVLDEAQSAGLDLDGVTEALVTKGVQLFAEAADNLLGAVADKRVAMLGDDIVKVSAKLPEAMQQAVDDATKDWSASGRLRELWAHDAHVWTGGDEANWLGWLRAVDAGQAELPKLQAFQDEVRQAGFTDVLLLGMGGSSLGPEVLGETFGSAPGFPKLSILDSTDPAQIRKLRARLDLSKTLCIVSSKSGSTLEPNIFKAYFWDEMTKAVGAADCGRHFVAVTDPGSKMQQVAEKDGFRHVFFGDKTIGGRYSVLSNFGLVPAAAIGLDLTALLDSTAKMVRSCASGTPPKANPGAHLGLTMGQAAKAGHDKLTIFASPGLHDVGAWLEQLVAESTGKIGRGIVPVDLEPIAAPAAYGQDRLFAYIKLTGEDQLDAPVAALEAAGHPVVRIEARDKMQLGQIFYVWEFAVAVAGAVIGIDPFDQPDVEASKIETRKLTDAYNQSGALPAEQPFATGDGLKLFADAKNAHALGTSVDAALKAQFARIQPGDYVALLAYVDRDQATIDALNRIRTTIRDKKHVATCVGFGPRFLHSTGQAYKGGPNTGVILQITQDHAQDLPVPGERYSFATVQAAQARGDFDVLAERGRRALRIHLGPDLEAGLQHLATLIDQSL